MHNGRIQMITLHTTLLLLAFITGWQVENLPDPTIEAVHEWNAMMDRHPEFVSPPSVSTPAPATQPWTGDVEMWRPLVTQYFQPNDVEWALAIIQCESSGNPNALHPGSLASGLMQHLQRYWADRSARAGWSGASVFDPEANIAVGAWLYYTGGPGHWVCKA